MARVIGIDLGTSNSAAAVMEGGGRSLFRRQKERVSRRARLFLLM